MSEAARHRQKAREHEQRENWKRAIEAYEGAIAEDKKARREVDLSLYNRIGDLYRRIGDVNRSVQYWEAAADGHISAGFYNNAIALCNKVLRNQPNRHSIYLKLGKIGAAKGFLSDASKHFLEYAQRMQKANQVDEAFRALLEFADISPDPDVRILIADQLLDHSRKPAAVEQLRRAWRDLGAEGREADAQELRKRIIQLDPSRDPEVERVEGAQAASYEDSVGLVDLPELEPLPFVDQDGSVSSGADDGGDGTAAGAVVDEEEVGAVQDDQPPDEAPGGDLTAEDLIGRMPTKLTEESDADVEPHTDPGLEIVPTGFEEEPTFGTPDSSAANDAFLAALDPTYTPTPEAPPEGSAGVVEPPPIDAAPPFDPLALEEYAPATPPADPLTLVRDRIEREGRQPDLLVELADALLEAGERDQAIADLRDALDLYQAAGQPNEANAVVAELLYLDINDMRAHQKQVELALQARDPVTLIDAYLDLGDCLDRTDAGNKAQVVYARVLELDPSNARAKAALEMLGDESVAPPVAIQPSEPAAPTGADFVDLGALVREEKRAKSTRFTIPAAEPQSEGEVDFAEMLNQFKSKVAESIEEEDTASHYDLGVAYKEMGLVDEAIAEFQIAARGLDYRLRAIESLGACFIDKGDHGIALKVLHRSLQGGYRDEELIGIFYSIGQAYEALGHSPQALEWFERVMGCDMNFADVASRVASLRT